MQIQPSCLAWGAELNFDYMHIIHKHDIEKKKHSHILALFFFVNPCACNALVYFVQL